MKATERLQDIDAVAIGCSAGGVEALCALLGRLPPSFPAAVLVVLHVAPDSPSFFEECFGRRCALPVTEAVDKEPILPGRVYFAPPDYHLLVEAGRTASLSTEPPIHFSRPSIDALFESAADCYRERLLGIVLTGASEDGAIGLAKVARLGGLTLAQDPATAKFPEMPRAALPHARAALSLEDIATLVSRIDSRPAPQEAQT